MKKILIVAFLTAGFFNAAEAQTALTPEMKTMTKAEKDAAKAKKEADLVEAFAKAGLSEDEQAKYRVEVDASNQKTKPIKADASLSDEDKKAKLDAIGKERNYNLKVILGEAKYKALKAVQKAQKEAGGNNK